MLSRFTFTSTQATTKSTRPKPALMTNTGVLMNLLNSLAIIACMTLRLFIL